MTQREIAFDGRKICIEFENAAITPLLDFLFCDLRGDDTLQISETLRISYEPEQEKWNLKHLEKSLFHGKSLNGLGVVLMGESLFHLIRQNETGLAIHAGLVSSDSKAILIPGSSGSGKSSITTWQICNGMRYHTDELVSINLKSHEIKAFTRPLNIKTNGVDAIKTLFNFDAVIDQIQVAAAVTMIPHRLVNPDFREEIPELTHIIFPKFSSDSESELIRLSGAEAGLEMMRSNVIARNLPSHGFGQVTKLVRNLPAYRLHYRNFGELRELINCVD